MFRRFCSLLFVLAACGSTEEPPDPMGTNSCGTSGAVNGMECQGLDTCGGSSNFESVTFCTHCFKRAKAGGQVCEAGVCRTLAAIPPNLISTIKLPAAAVASARSITQALILPVMADGTRVTCAALLSTCAALDNPKLNTAGSNFRNIANPGQGDVLTGGLFADEGDDRIYVVRATTEVQGNGNVVGVGCAENIDVTAMGAEVALDLRAP